MKITEKTIRTMLKNEVINNVVVLIIFVFLIFYFLTALGCAKGEVKPEAIVQQQPTLSAKGDRLNAELSKLTIRSNTNFNEHSDYKIGPEDLLEIDVFQVPELKTTARVTSQGYIKLQLGSEIHAAGNTTSELEKMIAKALDKYLQEPLVSVFIKEYKSQKISVLGYVKSPGVYYVSGQKTVLDLISLAGGLTAEAGDICVVQRTSGAEEKGNTAPEKIVIDIDQLLMGGHYEFNIPVQAGDVINIQKTGVFFVDGSVGSPGLYNLKGRVTLMQALTMAKGLNWEASLSDVKIYRDTGKPERDIIEVDYSEIMDKKIPDIDIKDKDIVMVGRNSVKSIIKGFAATLNFGMFSLGKAGL